MPKCVVYFFAPDAIRQRCESPITLHGLSRGGRKREHPMAKASSSCFRLTLIALATLVLTGPAYANLIFTNGQNINTGVQNLGSEAANVGPGTALLARISAFPTTFIELTSSGDRLVGTSGAGNICAAATASQSNCPGTPTALIHNVTITVPGHGFTRLVVNPNKPSVVGDVHYSVFTCVPENGVCVNPKTFTRALPPTLRETTT